VLVLWHTQAGQSVLFVDPQHLSGLNQQQLSQLYATLAVYVDP
jgi:hypothetical protein